MLRTLPSCQKGQSTVEYALLLGMLVLVVMTGIMMFGSKLQNSYDDSSTQIQQVNSR